MIINGVSQIVRVLLIAVLALVLHVLLGWEWTLGAAFLAGIVTPWHGWFVGAAGTALAWAALVLYSFWEAPESTRVFIDVLGDLAGNIPGSSIVALTVGLGALLGGLGGAIGTLTRPPLASALRLPR